MVFVGEGSIISGLGAGVKKNFDAMLRTESAVKDTFFPFSPVPFQCSTISPEDLRQLASGKDHLSRLEKMCFYVIDETLRLNRTDLRKSDTLLILSTTKGNIDALEHQGKYRTGNREYLSSIARTLSLEFGCASSPLIVSNACISGLLAIIIAKRFIEAGMYSEVVVCGADLVSEFTLSGFRSFNAISDEPCRPFDAERKGINLGEAAAAILITKNKTAVEIVAGHSANDANHISGPSKTGEGLYQALLQTLGPEKTVPDFINAHGTATIYNDEMESVAFHRAAIDHCPVNSFKGYFGHTLGAAGVLETLLGIESLRQNILIASKNFQKKGTTYLDAIISTNRSATLNSFLKTASGFGGCNAAALFIKHT